MKELVEYLVKNVVDNPDKVVVETNVQDGIDKLNVRVDQEDMGKVIGKNGKVIKAIRTLLKVKAIKENKRIYLELENQLNAKSHKD
jgi:predicted RNA-binding protein YlqC (UPF0109 family)